jgi:hypothetical protein
LKQNAAESPRCEWCHEPIEKPQRGQRFCQRTSSKKCDVLAWRAQHPEYGTAAPYAKPWRKSAVRPDGECDWCGDVIPDARPDQRFCRPPSTCRSNAGFKRHWEAVKAGLKPRRVLPAGTPSLFSSRELGRYMMDPASAAELGREQLMALLSKARTLEDALLARLIEI